MRTSLVSTVNMHKIAYRMSVTGGVAASQKREKYSKSGLYVGSLSYSYSLLPKCPENSRAIILHVNCVNALNLPRNQKSTTQKADNKQESDVMRL